MTPRRSPASGRLFVTIVLDGVGIGAQPDAGAYGDATANTLGHVCERIRPRLPNLGQAGLGLITPLAGVEPVASPAASWGKMQEQSAGKDSTTGHWELAGLRLTTPFPTYAEGFPEALITAFRQATGQQQVLGNEVASGTEIIERLGAEHVRTGAPIVYTSADSVFQVACHVDRVPLDRLYAWCALARTEVCVGEHGVGRVIARPFAGPVDAFHRLSEKRRDFALEPDMPTLQERLQEAGVRTVSVGKVADLFAGKGFDESIKTGNNSVGLARLADWVADWDGRDTFVWVNLIDFDQEYGHRNDAAGFGASLEEFDAALPTLRALMPEGSALMITADHGNDPTTPGTDHTREYVPVLFFDGSVPRDLGVRGSFADHAATVLDWFERPAIGGGQSFALKAS